MEVLREARGEKLHTMQEAWGGHARATTRAIVIVSTRMALQSRIMGVQVGPSLIRRDPRVQISFSLCTPKSRRPYANIRTKARNVAHMSQIAIATPMAVMKGQVK